MKLTAIAQEGTAADRGVEPALQGLVPGGLDAAVPPGLWQRALVGPATEFLRRPGKEIRAHIVGAGWRLAGGDGPAPAALTDAIELLHAGSLIVDDVEDGSDERRGGPALHHLCGVPLAINTGNWMYFRALARLGEAALPAEVQLALHRASVEALVRCHEGQALDLSVRIGELEPSQVAAVVAATTRLKTGALLGLAAFLGAAAAGAEASRVAAIAAFGEATGVGLQMLDDLGGITCASRRAKGREDLRAGRPTWPWAWLVDAAGELGFARLQVRARHLDALSPDDDVDGVAAALAAAVADTGRARAHHHLARALAALAPFTGGDALDAVAAELRTLEVSYG